MKKLVNLKGVKTLGRTQQKSINGGAQGCSGTGTGGVTSLGYAEICLSHPGENCLINGYQAACTNSGGGFWFY